MLALIGFLYYQPVRSYLESREEVARRTAEVRALERHRRALAHRLTASATTRSLEREARRLGFVKPGEQLVIVKGIGAWRRAQATIARRGHARRSRAERGR